MTPPGAAPRQWGEAAVFTDPVGTEPQVVAVSYQVSPLNGRYVAVKLQHDAAAAVVCGVLAAADGMYLPPGQWHDPGGMRWPSRRSSGAGCWPIARSRSRREADLLVLDQAWDSAESYLKGRG